MRRLIHMLMLCSLLFTSMDGAVDIAKAGHPHENPAAQQSDASDAVVDNLDDSNDSDGSFAPDHCEHCCHGHTSVVIPITASPHFGCHAVALGPYTDASILNFSPAPPTPPPNA